MLLMLLLLMVSPAVPCWRFTLSRIHHSFLLAIRTDSDDASRRVWYYHSRFVVIIPVPVWGAGLLDSFLNRGQQWWLRQIRSVIELKSVINVSYKLSR